MPQDGGIVPSTRLVLLFSGAREECYAGECHAQVPYSLKSDFRAGFRPDSGRESLKVFLRLPFGQPEIRF